MQGSLQKSLETCSMHVLSWNQVFQRYKKKQMIFVFAILTSFNISFWKIPSIALLLDLDFLFNILSIFIFFLVIVGSSWLTAVKELMEHYAQREASYPVLKQVILENLRKIRTEKVDEYNKVLIYDEE
jgi:hypothetical protein